MSTLMMIQRRCLLQLCSQSVNFVRQNSSSSKNKNLCTDLVSTKRTLVVPKASKTQVQTIKKLHRENKELFGVLLETKQEKVKRTRKELKLIKQQRQLASNSDEEKEGPSKKLLSGKDNESSSESVLDDEVDRTLNLILRDEKRRGKSRDSGSLPRASSVRLEHAGMSINKNRIKRDVVQDSNVMGKSLPSQTVVVRAHKRAEIEWAMRNAPTKIKLIELSPSSSSTSADDVDNARQISAAKGHSSASLPIEDDERKRLETSRGPSPSSSSFTSNNPHSQMNSSPRQKSDYPSPAVPAAAEQGANYMPTVEQLINSFYETGNGQLLPKSETRKMVVSTTKSSSYSSSNGGRAHERGEEELGGIHFNEQPQKSKTDGHNETQKGASSTNSFLIPYYNPDRNYRTDSEDNNHADDGGGRDHEKIAESIATETIITTFPFPFSSSRRHQDEASKTPASITPDAAAGVLSSQDFVDNKVIMKSESQQSPPLSPVPSLKLPSVSKILNATMPKEQAEALRRWEQRMIAEMGEQGFRQYKENILTNGKSLHSSIECYLRGTPLDEILIAEPNQGHWNSLNAVLASIDHVHVLESHVIHPKLQYCGVIDCVAEFRNRLVLIDWKTSQKPKPFVSMTYDTPLQIAAYIGAINYDERYSMKIDDGLIVVAYEDGSSCQTFMLRSMDVEKYWKLWLKRLKLFRMMNTQL